MCLGVDLLCPVYPAAQLFPIGEERGFFLGGGLTNVLVIISSSTNTGWQSPSFLNGVFVYVFVRLCVFEIKGREAPRGLPSREASFRERGNYMCEHIED